MPSASVRASNVARLSSKAKITAWSPRAAAATAYWTAIVDFPEPAGPISSVLVPRSGPPPNSVSSAVTPLLIRSRANGSLCSDATRRGKHDEPAFANRKIVVAAAKTAAAKLHDAESATFGAIDRRELLKRNDAVGNALQLKVRAFGGAIIEQKHGALATDEELLQGENLTTIAKRVLGQQPQLGERVENDAARIRFLPPHRGPSSVVSVNSTSDGWYIVTCDSPSRSALFGNQLNDLDAVERPAMRGGAGGQLLLGFGERDVEAFLAGFDAFEKVLERKRRLARPGIPIDEIEAMGNQPAVQDIIEARYASRRPLDLWLEARFGHFSIPGAEKGVPTASKARPVETPFTADRIVGSNARAEEKVLWSETSFRTLLSYSLFRSQAVRMTFSSIPPP